MSTIQAKIAAKKLTEATGVEDKIADQMFHRGEGGHYLAIVDLAFLERTEGRDEKHIVRLEISQLEIMPEGPVADHVRALMRNVYQHRQPKGLEGTEAEPVDRVIERGKNTLLTGDDDGPWPGDPDFASPDATDSVAVETDSVEQPKRRGRKTAEPVGADA